MNLEKNIIISDPEEFERKKVALRTGGADKLHVLSDFDRTLTYAMVDGYRRDSLMAILRDEKHLAPDYSEKSQSLREKYYPIETDFSIPLGERKDAMKEWWTKAFQLFIEAGLNRKDIEKVIASKRIKLRDGVTDFVLNLNDLCVPVVIMSATGLGEEAITLFFEKEGKLFENIHVVSNSLEWDEKDFLKKVKEPIIHALNKDEAAIHQFPVYEKIKDRKNILLLGDGPGDASMNEGFDADVVLKIGFLNEKVEENLKHYQKLFDVVLLGDPSFDFVNKLVKEILQ